MAADVSIVLPFLMKEAGKLVLMGLVAGVWIALVMAISADAEPALSRFASSPSVSPVPASITLSQGER